MDRFQEALLIAFANLRSNSIRSLLSMLGIVIGIGSVVFVLAFGAGIRDAILSRVNRLGVNTYYITPHYDKKTYRMGEITLADIKRVQNIPFVLSAFPSLRSQEDIRSRSNKVKGVIRGINETFLKAQNMQLVQGRDFSALELERLSYVCLVRAQSVPELFSDGKALGKTLYIRGLPFDVVGVYSRKKKSRKSLKQKTRITEVLIPIQSYIRTDDKLHINRIEVFIKPDVTEDATRTLIETMEKSDPKRKGLYRVQDQQEHLERRLEIGNMLSMIGVVVACISLLVGGIGMMNVMLTSVAERIREIGLRRAVGARRIDILIQFLVESCVLSGIGGLLGLLFGAVLSKGFPFLFGHKISTIPQIQPSFILLAVGGGCLIGIIFGLYPGIKASHYSPAEALRTE